ncbi:MAG TPA: hypothetical protein VLM38_22285 [Blastocatellia bacterium]|nr:hypothetical protein [Blastocatellia bacterium]
MVAIQHRTLTETQQPELARLAKEFEMIKISPVLPDELRVDETSYEIWSQSLWGNRIEIRLGGPGSEVEKQPHPILEWAESFRHITKLQ